MATQRIEPWGTFEMDDSTGMPVVPEGHFWRVKRVWPSFWEVQLRKKRPGWFSEKVEYATFSTYRGITRTHILDGAGYCLTRTKRVKMDNSLLGDYPPKTLKGES